MLTPDKVRVTAVARKHCHRGEGRDTDANTQANAPTYSATELNFPKVTGRSCSDGSLTVHKEDTHL